MCASSHLQVCVEDPDEGADGWVTAGFEHHKSSWTVLSPEAGNKGRGEDRDIKEMKLTRLHFYQIDTMF